MRNSSRSGTRNRNPSSGRRRWNRLRRNFRTAGAPWNRFRLAAAASGREKGRNDCPSISWHYTSSGRRSESPPIRQPRPVTRIPQSARKPVVLPGNLSRSRRWLQPESLKTKHYRLTPMTRRRTGPKPCHSVPFSAILQKIRPHPTTSLFPSLRQAVATDIPALLDPSLALWALLAKAGRRSRSALRSRRRLPGIRTSC